MKTEPKVRAQFQRPLGLLVQVTPKGFEIDDEPFDFLEGRVAKTQLVRKLFEESALICDSADGVTSRSGKPCQDCRHSRCKPMLRLHLLNGNLLYVLDLAASSAENYFALEDDAQAKTESLEEWNLRLTVLDRGYWGEVIFARV